MCVPKTLRFNCKNVKIEIAYFLTDERLSPHGAGLGP